MLLTLILCLSIIIVVSTIGAGVYFLQKGESKRNSIKKFLGVNISLFVPLLLAVIFTLAPDIAAAAEGGLESIEGEGGRGLGFIAAALSTGLAAWGAGVAVGNVGSAALGAVSEDDKMLGKTLIFVGLAEGIAIYGLIATIMILGRL